MITEEQLHALQERIGYRFRDGALLWQAMTHSSFANEMQIGKRPDYERLEFLGDAVLELSTSVFLYTTFPDGREGTMTRLRASLVCEEALHRKSAAFDVASCILLGKGEERTGGREKPSIIADVTEALIGAIYLDGGFAAADAFIRRFLLDDVVSDAEDSQPVIDYKTRLQELLQARGAETIVYREAGMTGPEHAPTFFSAVYSNDKKLGEGSGRTKKAAEQQAACAALQTMSERAGDSQTKA